MITWTRFAGMKSQPAQQGQILPYDYIGTLNFIPARRDNFPRGFYLNLNTFLFNFSLLGRRFSKIHRFRSRHQRRFLDKKLILRILNIHRKHMFWSNFIKKRLQRRFSCKYCKSFKNISFEEHCERLLLSIPVNFKKSSAASILFS